MAFGRGLYDRLTGGRAAPGGSTAPVSAAPAGSGSGTDRAIAPPNPGNFWRAGDVARRLPPAARAKFLRLREDDADRSLMIQGINDQRRARVEALSDRQRNYERLQLSRAGGSGGHGPMARSTYSTFMTRGAVPLGGVEHRAPDQHAGERQLAEAEREVEVARAELDAINARIATHEARTSRLAAALGDWIASIPAGVAIEMHRDSTANRKVAPTSAAVELVRRQLAEKLAQRQQVAASPYPAEECKKLVREQVKALGARSEPD